jgi:MSHA biogenesis protein MshK
MDEAVKNLFLTALACLALAQPAAAQALLDPTRPPPGMDRVATELAAADDAPRLQSVLIARHAGGRHVAVIDGETVRLGESFKGARVARVSANEVVLVRGAERQVLRMDAPLPGMTPAAK